MFETILETVLPLFFVGVTTFLLPLLTKLYAKVKNDWARGVLDRLDDAVFAAADEVSQTWVAAIKAGRADGQLTDQEKAEAKAAALAAAKRYLGPKGLALLMKVLGLSNKDDVDAVVTGRVESALAKQKRAAFDPFG